MTKRRLQLLQIGRANPRDTIRSMNSELIDDLHREIEKTGRIDSPDASVTPSRYEQITQLYKYKEFPEPRTEARAWLGETLDRKALFAPSLDMLNDPAETLLDVHGVTQGDSDVRWVYEALVAREIHRGWGVVSFSETPTNALMWSHYGGEGRGLCLEYSRVGCRVLGGPMCQPVFYTNVQKKLTVSDEGGRIGWDHTQLDDLYRIKPAVWSYEHEWRLVWPKECVYAGDLLLTGVVFGPRAQQDAVEFFLDNTSPDVGMRVVQPVSGRYELETVDLSDSRLWNGCADLWFHPRMKGKEPRALRRPRKE